MPSLSLLAALAALTTGFGLVLAGVAMIYRPAAYILAGVLIVGAVADVRNAL